MEGQYNLDVLRLGFTGGLISRWRRAAGLVAGSDRWLPRNSVELVRIRPDKRFDRFVRQQVAAYVERGELPTADVAPGILDLAAGLMAGQEPTLRAGDYIAIQNHLRQAQP